MTPANLAANSSTDTRTGQLTKSQLVTAELQRFAVAGDHVCVSF